MQKNWLIADPITPQAGNNLQAFHPVLRQLLFNRGIGTSAAAASFLSAEPEFDTDPLQMAGMATAIERITLAVERHETIAVYGDYDVDGVTATALLIQALVSLGASAQPYIPNRFEEGYGLNNEALDLLAAGGARLVVTVDCGIRSSVEAEHARNLGIDLIITDHHHPAEGELPSAVAVVNPKQPGDMYPEKDLAGVGIAYKLADALTRRLRNARLPDSQLDLVALGTVADLAPLIGENRHLVRRGLAEMRHTGRQGLYSLSQVAGHRIERTTAANIGFVLGPRLNAAGRLKSAMAALELLLTEDPVVAGKLAQELEVANQERQAVTRETQAAAETLAITGEAQPALLFAADEKFNPGVVGLAASRLVEAYYRPAVVAAIGPEETRGSCRSIPEFHITDALDQCADLLVRHGGHAAAAGFTVKNANLPALIDRLKALAANALGAQDLRPTLHADAEIELSSLSFDLLRQLEQLEPTGYGNSEPLFVSRAVKVRSSRTVGQEGRHLKLMLQDERGVTTDAIGFRLGGQQKDLPAHVDLAYVLESNEYNGRTTLQLNIKDIRPSGA